MPEATWHRSTAESQLQQLHQLSQGHNNCTCLTGQPMAAAQGSSLCESLQVNLQNKIPLTPSLSRLLPGKGSLLRDVMQEKEISLLLAFTITCEGNNPEFPLHWDGIEVSAPASSLRTPKVQPKVPVAHQNKRAFSPSE